MNVKSCLERKCIYTEEIVQAFDLHSMQYTGKVALTVKFSVCNFRGIYLFLMQGHQILQCQLILRLNVLLARLPSSC